MPGDKESEVTTIPQIRRVFRMAKAELDALAGLRDGALGYATDETILYRQNGNGAANWEAITSLATGFEEIADILTTGSVASVAFTDIPGGYAHFLILIDNLYGDSADSQLIALTFNEDGGANYDHNTNVGQTQIYLGITFGDTDGDQRHTNVKMFIDNQASKQKFVSSEHSFWKGSDNNTADPTLKTGKWRNTIDEISRIDLTANTGNIIAGSRFILMGVKT